MGLFRAKTVMGVDIGSCQVKLAVVRPGQPLEVLSYASFPTPPDAVEDGVVVPSERLVNELRTRISAMPKAPVVVSVSTRQAAVRTAVFPRMSERELVGVLRWQADRYIPLPGEHVWDSTIVTGTAPEMNVLLVAATRSVVDGVSSALRRAGAALVAVDLDSMAAVRAMEAIGAMNQDPDISLILDLGEEGTRLTVLSAGVPAVNRFIPTGGIDFSAAVNAGRSLPDSEIEELRREYGVNPDSPVFNSIKPVLDRLLDEIGRSVHFYLSRHRGRILDRVYLIGGVALLPGIPRAVESYLSERVPAANRSSGSLVCLVDPSECKGLRIRKGARRDSIEPLDPRYVISIGLALWKGKKR